MGKTRKNRTRKIKIGWTLLTLLLVLSFLVGKRYFRKVYYFVDAFKKYDECYLNTYERKLIKKVKLTDNAKQRLNIVSSYGDNAAYHPKVLYFENGWHGYTYWMAYTPYPKSNDIYENPHIMVSNDMINWKVPEGLKNPLDEPEDIDKYHRYNSDTHIVYNDDLDQLELYWRYVDYSNGRTVTLFKKVSKDGIHWGNKKAILYSDDMKKFDFFSPAIIYEDGIYKMWFVNANRKVNYLEFKDNKVVENSLTELDIKYSNDLKSWHLDVIKTDKGYEMLILAYPHWDFYHYLNLYYTVSKDGKNFSKATMVMHPPAKKTKWDGQGLYRSTFIYKDGMYYVWYSGRNRKYRGIGIAFGKDIHNLKATNIKFLKDKNAALKFQIIVKREMGKN